MKRRFLIVLLVLVLFLQGCQLPQLLTELPDALNDWLHSAQSQEYSRPYTPREEPLPFSQLSYARPDAEQLCADFEALTQTLEADSVDLDTVLDRYDALYSDYVWFDTMTSLAYIHYTLDLGDGYYEQEYTWCSAQLYNVEQAMEGCYLAMARSALRDELEELYFGEDFFLSYDSEGVYSDDHVVELFQEDSDLQSEYLALQLDSQTLDEQYEEAAELYIRLIRVRRELAQALGYDSYAQFAYDFYYTRDYTPEQTAQYTADIAASLSDLAPAALRNFSYSYMRPDKALSLLEGVADSLGGEFAEAYDYMLTYELYDLSDGESKMEGSYTTYLESYEMPYLFLAPTDTSDDLLTLTHEFGHFVDGYVNCNLTTTIDCAEIFSNGLEYLMLDRVALSDSKREKLTKGKLADSLYLFLSQACYAEFERRAYALPDEELTAERLGEIFYQCNEEFGLLQGFSLPRDTLEKSWCTIHHFYIAPFYVISYCVSEDVALQLYQREQADGLDAYRRLLECSAGNTFLSLLSDAQMDSPFVAGRMEKLRALYQAAFSVE